MNQVFAGSIALILALLLWGIGKKSKKGISQTTENKFLSSNNQSQTSLVKETRKKDNHLKVKQENTNVWTKPKTKKQKIILKSKLFKLIQAGPEERLYAVQIATKWGDSSVLPIIRRGLKDSDSNIVIAAAKGIDKYKRNSSFLYSNSSRRLPLNIFLMR
tara:strand:+ start:101 stop:580 length:480 start_codon:yes stop_codon:yes gene_type:complete